MSRLWGGAAALVLAGCSTADVRNFSETDVPAELITVDAETLAFTFEDGTELELSSEEVGLFTVGDNPNSGILATFSDESALAMLTVQVVEDGTISEVDVARLSATEMPETGTARYSGVLVGQFRNLFDDHDHDDTLRAHEVEGDPTALLMPSDIRFEVDFAERSIEGEVRRRTLTLFGDLEFVLSPELSLDLLPTEIRNNGSFQGVAQYLQPDPEVERNEGGTYSGLIAGETGQLLVGDIETPLETGVFAVEIEPEETETPSVSE